MKVPEKSGGNDRIGAMLRDLPASLDEVQVGKSLRQPVSRPPAVGGSPGDLPSAERRGLEALPEPAQQIRQERKHALTESLQHASAVRDQDEPEGRCVVPAAVKS